MANKKYYWLKLKKDFFKEDTIAWLEEQPCGETLVIIYLKMLLKSLNSNGFFKIDKLFSTGEEELALILDEDVSLVSYALDVFLSIGLVKKDEQGNFIVMNIMEREV